MCVYIGTHQGTNIKKIYIMTILCIFQTCQANYEIIFSPNESRGLTQLLIQVKSQSTRSECQKKFPDCTICLYKHPGYYLKKQGAVVCNTVKFLEMIHTGAFILSANDRLTVSFVPEDVDIDQNVCAVLALVFYKGVKLVGGGFVITGAYPVQCKIPHTNFVHPILGSGIKRRLNGNSKLNRRTDGWTYGWKI